MINTTKKATSIQLLNFSSPAMRAFHCSWFAFFLCFFGWFGIAPLMPVIRKELSLSQEQIGNIIIASVAITVFARLIIGYLCDRFGPRKTYTGLLMLGAFPVMLIGLSNSYESFLICRLLIGAIGASFVITQYHTSVMFAPNIIGTANATSAGWGNLGGGVTQMVMPVLFTAILALGFSESLSWRLAMVIPGIAMLIMGTLYFFLTQDTPKGNFIKEYKKSDKTSFLKVASDYRVWSLFLIYGACFGVELTINNIAALYFADSFTLDLKTAGLIAGLFGLMNIFARTLGGFFGDRAGNKYGLKGRVAFMGIVLFLEGLALMSFSMMTSLPFAIGLLIIFSLFVQMAEGATFSVVPFVNKKSIGIVSGIVGAGGNAGAVATGFLFKSFPYSEALFYLGIVVSTVSVFSLAVRFSAISEKKAKADLDRISEEAKELEIVPA